MKAKEKDPVTIRRIQGWLKKNGNTKALLASKLEYNSSQVVDQWLERGRVPDHQKQRILEAIK